MDLRAQILLEHSKANALTVAGWIGQDAGRFKMLIDLFLKDDYRVVQRAAHIISMVAGKYPGMPLPYLSVLIEKMQESGQPVAVKRNVVRILQYLEIPEDLHGPVMNTCFDFLRDVKEAVAVRAFSMTVLARLAKHYPEIKQELRTVIEEGLEQHPTPGFRSRGLKVLAALSPSTEGLP